MKYKDLYKPQGVAKEDTPMKYKDLYKPQEIAKVKPQEIAKEYAKIEYKVLDKYINKSHSIDNEVLAAVNSQNPMQALDKIGGDVQEIYQKLTAKIVEQTGASLNGQLIIRDMISELDGVLKLTTKPLKKAEAFSFLNFMRLDASELSSSMNNAKSDIAKVRGNAAKNRDNLSAESQHFSSLRWIFKEYADSLGRNIDAIYKKPAPLDVGYLDKIKIMTEFHNLFKVSAMTSAGFENLQEQRMEIEISSFAAAIRADSAMNAAMLSLGFNLIGASKSMASDNATAAGALGVVSLNNIQEKLQVGVDRLAADVIKIDKQRKAASETLVQITSGEFESVEI